MKRYTKIAAAMGVLLTLSACGLVEKVDKNGNPIDPNEPERVENYDIAKFEDETITFYDLEREMSPIALTLTLNYGAGFLNGEGKKLHDQLHHTMTAKIIEDKVLDEKIKVTDLEIDKDSVKAAAKERQEQMKLKLGEHYEGAIQAMGFDSEKQYLERLEKEELRKAFYKLYKNGISVTEKEVEDEYKNNPNGYKKLPGAEIYHIYLGIEKEEAEKTGTDILEKIKNGVTFGDAAKEFGQDATSKDGGKLGYYNYDTPELHKDFMDHVRKMKDGEISGVVESTAGFHIIMVKDVVEKEILLPLEEVKEQIEKNLYQSKLASAYQTDMAKWKEEYKIEIYTDKLPKLESEEPEEPTETPVNGEEPEK